MIRHIDVGVVLRRTVCELYSNLVTRPTGAAVRTEIEQQISAAGDRTLTVIDFANVSLLDYSCADEVIAKLIMKYRSEPESGAYFIFRGVGEAHIEPIEAVLERHGIAIVLQAEDGGLAVIGRLTDSERQTWDAVARLRRIGRGDAELLTDSVDNPLRALEELSVRGLVMQLDDEYLALGELPS